MRADLSSMPYGRQVRRAETIWIGTSIDPVLAKIQFGAIEGEDKQRAASPILRGSTIIAMMQAAGLREGNNVIVCGG